MFGSKSLTTTVRVLFFFALFFVSLAAEYSSVDQPNHHPDKF